MYPEKKIIYLIDQPLDDFNIERFFIDEIEQKGWIIQIWDFTKIYHKTYFEKYYENTKIKKDKRLKIINNYEQFKNNINTNGKNTFYFDHLSRGSHFLIYRIRKLLKNKKKIRVVFSSANFPIPSQKINYFEVLKKNSIKKIIHKIYDRLIIKYYKYCDKPDIYFTGGNLSRKNYLSKSALHMVEAHNFDYDKFLNENKKIKIIKKNNSAVFIDQDMCFHFDRYIRHSDPFVSPQKYFPSIIKFFKFLEGEKKINIKISLHPRCNSNINYAQHFKGFNLSNISTSESIFNSEFVIAHYSTSIQLAVLLYKPILFITTNELEKSERKGFVKKFANTLGKTPININENFLNINWDNEFKINKAKYDEYIYNFVKTDLRNNLSLVEIANIELNKIIS